MAPPRFRTRLFLTLSLFAVLPAAVLTLLWAATLSTALPLLSGSDAWDRVAASGERALASARAESLSAPARAALAAHEQELAASVTQARRYRYLAVRAVPIVLVVAAAAVFLLAVVASRVAGHLARQLSRPLDELVGWTDRIAHALPLPVTPPRRGAPEFEVLRRRMRAMATDLEAGRVRDLEAERLRAFRETARQVAHELKNPLTPIRLAVGRLQRDAPPTLRDTVDVLATESARLEEMARSFSQFGRLPEGPASDIDVGEMARYTTRAAVPSHIPVSVEVDPGVPLVRGHYDTLARALTNVLLNACDACAQGGAIQVHVATVASGDAATSDAVRILVRDSGTGIPADRVAHVWEPYVTNKPGGTGLGLAITRQAVEAHGGRVELTSVVGQGTDVSLTLPAANAAPPAANGDGSADYSARPGVAAPSAGPSSPVTSDRTSRDSHARAQPPAGRRLGGATP
jgi:nitrogen fixation/metabolism regulation signal transduction histidine kinase